MARQQLLLEAGPMSYTKANLPEFTDFSTGFRTGWDKGWHAHESHMLAKVMERDPAVIAWLERLLRLAEFNRERDELALQQQQAAAQAIDDDACNP
jgi:hypothetical protein